MARWLMVLALLVPVPMWAEAWSHGCTFSSLDQNPGRPTDFLINAGNVGCYRFINGESTPTSDLIVVQAQSAVWCFDPNLNDTSTTTARVTIHRCTTGAAGGTGSVNNCVDTGGANGRPTLTGQGGAASVQNACKRTGPGVYFVRVVANCTAAAGVCEVSVRGESAQP